MYLLCTHLKILADLVVEHIVHFIEGTKVLASYMAVQCECQERAVGILELNCLQASSRFKTTIISLECANANYRYANANYIFREMFDET